MLKAGRAQCLPQNILTGQLGCVGHRMASEEGSSCPGRLVWPTASQKHVGGGPCLGQRDKPGTD